MVLRVELTYSEIANLLDVKYNSTSSTGYTLPPGISENSYIYSLLKSALPNEVKVNIVTGDIRLR